MRRWSFLVGPVTVSLILIACGSDDSSTFIPGNDAGTGPDTTSGGPPLPDGSLGGGDSGSGACTPKTCAQLGFDCGPNGDGCGNLIDCGKCSGSEFCGGGGFSKCGGNTSVGGGDSGADGGTTCVKETCASKGYTCGVNGDGCGGTISCGTCTPPAFCGGGGFSQCGGNTGLVDGGGCVSKTCAQLGFNCGPNNDGCGNIVNCGNCTAPEFCGGGGFSQCGGNTNALDGGSICTPLTCAQQGFNCGPAGDGCGNLIPNCGSCTAPDICGGGGQPNVCGDSNIAPDGGQNCTGLCLQQTSCDGGGTTTISGTVVAPTDCSLGYCAAGQTAGDPIYGALVYIPNGTVQPFTAGVACDCGEVTGNPLVTFTTGPDGKFTLTNAPVGSNIPLVIQLGRWRRQIVIPTVTACTNNPLNTNQTRLPRNHTEGDIPFTAIDTGAADSIHCILPEIGIDGAFTSGEYTNGGSATGRVQFYQNTDKDTNGSGPGQVLNGSTPPASNLFNSSATLSQYDEVIFDCVGFEDDNIVNSAAALQNVLNYGNSGGRIFLSHYSYVWSFTNSVWGTPPSDVATWNGNQNDPTPDPGTGDIDQTTQVGKDFATWLKNVGALAAVGPPAKITVAAPRFNASAVNKPTATQFVLEDSVMSQAGAPFLFSWDPPVGPDAGAACGRVVYSDFHVNDTASNNGISGTGTFPDACGQTCAKNSDCTLDAAKPHCLIAGSTGNGHCVGPMTPQEKAFEFVLFDLASCITSSGAPPPTCSPLTCANVVPGGATCGDWGDGCGNTLSCGTCAGGSVCDKGVCVSTDGGGCTPKTCAELGVTCGKTGDGCGNALDCGPCDGGFCQSQTCAQQGISCGPAGDGCGNQIDCGGCDGGTCGGGGVQGQCGNSDGGFCTPLTCQAQNIGCGPAGDGCGNLIQCGNCTPPATCGGGGTPNQCGTPPR